LRKKYAQYVTTITSYAITSRLRAVRNNLTKLLIYVQEIFKT